MVQPLPRGEPWSDSAEAPAQGAVGRWPGRLAPLLTRPELRSGGTHREAVTEPHATCPAAQPLDQAHWKL